MYFYKNGRKMKSGHPQSRFFRKDIKEKFENDMNESEKSCTTGNTLWWILLICIIIVSVCCMTFYQDNPSQDQQ